MHRPFTRFGLWISVFVFLLAAGPASAYQAEDAPPQLAPEAEQPAEELDATQPAEPAAADAGIEPPPSDPEVIKERYPGGELQVLRHCYKGDAGKLINHGPWSWWTPDGTKTAFGQFVHGKRHGEWTRWFAPGEGPMFADPMYRAYAPPFVSVAEFAHGKLHGKWIISDGRKQKISEWTFVDGVQQGPWIWWDGAGGKLREVHYDHGVLEGKALTWGSTGKVEEEYIAGRQKFPKHWWFPGPGRRKHVEGWYLGRRELTKTTYDWWEAVGVTVGAGWEGKDERHGQWTWWYPNGQIETEGAYAFDQRVGQWTWFDPEGKVIKERDFTPADTTPADFPPADTLTDDSAGSTAPAAGGDAVDAAPAEETPAEETPAEETPAEETPAEETPAEETPAEETLTDDGGAVAPEAGDANSIGDE